jgi:phytoene dehydrogenase-like protein
LVSEPIVAAQILKATNQTTLEHLDGLSLRFRRFVDLQLTALTQGTSAEVPYLLAAMALSTPLGGMFAISGGSQALADKLAESIKRSGGTIRLNTPVLRLAYDVQGGATGVDLLTGETVLASRSVISNLTIWDTYGKLIGLNRTPSQVRQQLKSLRSWGAFLVYLGVEEDLVSKLPSSHLLALTEWQEDLPYDPQDQLLIAAAPDWEHRAPDGKRAVTVHTFTDVDDWFTFHTDDAEREEKDQQALDRVWERLHAVVPDLLNDAEVIETATPRTFYEQTRRKLGMVGGLVPKAESFWQSQPPHETSVPNLHIVSDTTSPGGIAGLTNSALILANHITGR